MSDAYAKSKGVLFINETANPKAPKFKGNIVVTKEQIKPLIAALKSGEEPKLNIAGWEQTSERSGADYISLQTDIKTSVSPVDPSEDLDVSSGTSTNPFA